MKNILLDAKSLIMVSGSSKGTQPKYYDSGYWYKTDNIGYEGLSEYLVSLVLRCSNVEQYVEYERCLINGKNGCRSKSFLDDNEQFISFERLHQIYYNQGILDVIMRMNEIPDRIKYVKDFIKDVTDVDITGYLSKILTLDALTLNKDRHFNNLGVVSSSRTNKFKEAPIFDNGAALFSDFNTFDSNDFEENLQKVVGMPFSSNLDLQAHYAGMGLKIDYGKLQSLLSKEKPSRALTTLQKQIELKKEMIPGFSKQELKRGNKRLRR